MTLWEALFLGAVQGLTEFLPISSSGHIELAKVVLADGQTQALQGPTFTVLVHLGSAVAITVFLLREGRRMLRDAMNVPEEKPDGLVAGLRSLAPRWIGFLVLATLPAAAVGVFLEDTLDPLFTGNTVFVGIALLLNGFVLLLADSPRFDGDAKVHETPPASRGGLRIFLVGVAQAFAILPGISRSGATVTAGLWARLSREEALRFSFALGLVAILGATVLKLKDMQGVTRELGVTAMAGAFLSSLLVSYGALWLLWVFVKKRRLRWFSGYCWLVGAAALIHGLTA